MKPASKEYENYEPVPHVWECIECIDDDLNPVLRDDKSVDICHVLISVAVSNYIRFLESALLTTKP